MRDAKRVCGVPKERVFLIFLLIILLGGSTISFQGCAQTAVKNTYTPTEWRDMLKQAGDWVPLPYPESAFRPGSIIRS